MDQTLLKYWKTCLQDAERKAIALKGPRITLNIGDKILKFRVSGFSWLVSFLLSV